MNDDIFIINVQIGGFPIALKIPRKDEEIYRNAEKLVTKLIEEYNSLYNQRAYEDILKLVAFQLAVRVSKSALHEDPSPLSGQLKKLEQEIDDALNS
ncbi:MAG: hypothetical protein BGO29_03195 [Bacteroidales bacterium 36-12]|nr:MAG: hypothetical protein BGO29_03195 [Bacteroidales bacterium 36-12]